MGRIHEDIYAIMLLFKGRTRDTQIGFLNWNVTPSICRFSSCYLDPPLLCDVMEAGGLIRWPWWRSNATPACCDLCVMCWSRPTLCVGLHVPVDAPLPPDAPLSPAQSSTGGGASTLTLLCLYTSWQTPLVCTCMNRKAHVCPPHLP